MPANKTYYAGINDAGGRIGAISKNEFTSGGYRSSPFLMTFETFSPTLIESARMYFGNSGRITAVVTNESTGVQTAATTFEVLATHPTPQAGDVNENNPLDTGRVMPLNLNIPIAGRYTLTISAEDGATAFRNNSGPVPYPYIIPGLMSITGTNGNPSTSFYYFFYDMKVKSIGCPKPGPRQTVVAANPLTPVITQNGAVLTSSVTTGSLQWFFDGNLVNGATNSSFTIIQAGTFAVSVTLGTCSFRSADFTTSITSIPPLNPVEINLMVTNNPGNGLYNVLFNVKKKEKIYLEILNINGQIILRNEFEIPAAGAVNKEIDLTGNASGIYLMKLFFDKKQYVHKLIRK